MTNAAPFHVGLNPARVIDAAVELTRKTHLMSWSIRHLASRLDVAPSVIYHHVGGKDLLCQGVVERILELVELPSTELPWDEWFRDMLRAMGPLAAEYPGTAKWMLLHGPTLPAALPVLESGLSALHSAGFGDRADTAYAALFNNAMLTVSIGDDRLQHEGDGPRDHFTMMSNFSDMPLSSRARAMGEHFIHPFAEGGETAARMRWDYYRVIVDVTISGVRTLLGPRQKP